MMETLLSFRIPWTSVRIRIEAPMPVVSAVPERGVDVHRVPKLRLLSCPCCD
jgi:hypothetical protein